MRWAIILAAVQLQAIPWMFPETVLTQENPVMGVVPRIDSYGNGLAAWVTARGVLQVSIYEAGAQAWREPCTIGGAHIAVAPAVCVNDRGDAMVCWVQGAQLVARMRHGGIVAGQWEPPLDEEPMLLSSGDIAGIAEVRVAMNAKGEAAVVWSETRRDPIRDVAMLCLHRRGAWSEPVVLWDDGKTDTIDAFPSVSVNDRGDLGVAWKFQRKVVARQCLQGLWMPPLAEPPVALSQSHGRSARSAIDAEGKMVAVWICDEAVEGARVVEGERSEVTTLGMAVDAPALAVAANGSAVVAWPSLGDMIFASVYTKENWSLPLMISQIGASNPSAAMDGQANATVVWENSVTGTVQMADLYRGVWQTPEDLFPVGADPRWALVDLSPSGNTLVSWKTQSGTGEVAVCLKNRLDTMMDRPQVVAVPLLPNIVPKFEERLCDPELAPLMLPRPSSLTALGDPPGMPVAIAARRIRNQFAGAVEIVHEVSWAPAQDMSVVGYQVFVNNTLVGQVDRHATLFRHRNQPRTGSTIYQLRAVSAEGLQSPPLSVRVE